MWLSHTLPFLNYWNFNLKDSQPVELVIWQRQGTAWTFYQFFCQGWRMTNQSTIGNLTNSPNPSFACLWIIRGIYRTLRKGLNSELKYRPSHRIIQYDVIGVKSIVAYSFYLRKIWLILQQKFTSNPGDQSNNILMWPYSVLLSRIGGSPLDKFKKYMLMYVLNCSQSRDLDLFIFKDISPLIQMDS